jgi:DNA primase
MGKLSPISIKYLIRIKFFANGIVEKPDVIGAIFGQTEGLLGEELELRELQKKGKIGRIEVELKYEGEKSSGIVEVPTALNKTETTLIAAAIETIDRIGPAEAKFEVVEVRDVREEKRKYIVERAKELLKSISAQIPETKEIEEAVKIGKKVSEITEIGEEKLAAGNIEGKELIVVEGRADVVNLVKHNIDNVIAMNGINVPETIKRLSKEKVVTLFIDGDRGGILLAKSAIKNANIAYVAMAPEGKEVEELTGKEILAALRKRKTVQEFLEEIEKKEKKRRKQKEEAVEGEKEKKKKRTKVKKVEKSEKIEKIEEAKKKRKKAEEKKEGGIKEVDGSGLEIEKEEGEREEQLEEKREIPLEQLSKEEIYKKISAFLSEAAGSKSAYIINRNLKLVKVLPLGNLKFMLRRFYGYCLIVDGSVDDYLIDIAERSGFKIIAARNFIIKRSHNAVLISF